MTFHSTTDAIRLQIPHIEFKLELGTTLPPSGNCRHVNVYHHAVEEALEVLRSAIDIMVTYQGS